VTRRRWLVAAGVVLLALLGAALAYVLVKRHEGRNIRGSSTVEFTTTTTAAPKPPPPGIVWPTYGYDAARRRVAPDSTLEPPYRVAWTFRAHSLLEFPPAVAYGNLYLATNNGRFYAISEATGGVVWKDNSDRCVAASPAVAKHVVYESFLNRPPCNASGSGLDGEVVAYDAKTGAVRWRTTIGPSESSPLVSGSRVFVGDWNGDVLALDAGTGKQLWSFRTGDKVKGAVAESGGVLYIGSYDGHVYALDPRSGKELWRASAQARLGPTGTFYATPAIGYGRVYIGATDGKVYSFGARSGDERWSHGTGSYVYSSAALWRERVLVGSYDGNFYSFDAATGDELWRFSANGPISGSPTILNGIVYFATLKQRTYALRAASGKPVWTFPDGKYTPVVADKHRLFLVGYTRLYGMVPK
jgi:outer membrane protein assembly factor BamB